MELHETGYDPRYLGFIKSDQGRVTIKQDKLL
jgi:hypothetical protein